ncbi:MAG: DNA alkylation repair protein [Isosphaeraceae bacterium]
MKTQEIIDELRSLGGESTKRTLMRHGAREPFFGVKVEDLKKIQKRVKTDHALALELYDTGISDAMYLAGLIADDPRMTRADLQRWADGAYWSMLSEYTVPWVASGGPHGPSIALEWIESNQAQHAAAGWATLSSLASTRPDDDLDLDGLAGLLQRVGASIHDQPNRVRYVMNGFVIAVGGYVPTLRPLALATAAKVGVVSVDMEGTACKVPFAKDYIDKMAARGVVKKRKSAKC